MSTSTLFQVLLATRDREAGRAGRGQALKPISALGFDFGSKNIGVAHGQSLTQSGEPLAVLPARDGIPDWKRLTQLINEWQPKLLVVGLPLNMDGSDSELTRRARKFGNRLHARSRLAVHFMDERLSSREAKYQAQQRGHSGDYRRAPVDAIAAGLILQSFWSQYSLSASAPSDNA